MPTGYPRSRPRTNSSSTTSSRSSVRIRVWCGCLTVGDADARATQCSDREHLRQASTACCSGGCVRSPLRGPDATAPLTPLDSLSDRQRLDVRLVEPSGARFGCPTIATSATMWPGMSNSASSNPLHSRSTASLDCGSMTRSAKRWRSPTKVSDCQSVDRISVSKILSRGTAARATNARSSAAAAGDIRRRFIARPRDRRGHGRWCRTRIAPVAQVEYEAGISNDFSSENGLERFHYGAKIFLLLGANHCSPHSRIQLGGVLLSNAIPTCLGIFLSLYEALMLSDPRSSLSVYVSSAGRILPAFRGCSGATLLTSSNSSGGACRSGSKEEERRKLARYFSISETILGRAAGRVACATTGWSA